MVSFLFKTKITSQANLPEMRGRGILRNQRLSPILSEEVLFYAKELGQRTLHSIGDAVITTMEDQVPSINLWIRGILIGFHKL